MKDTPAKEVRTFVYPGLTARVYIPALTNEERTRRLTLIHTEARNFMKKVQYEAT